MSSPSRIGGGGHSQPSPAMGRRRLPPGPCHGQADSAACAHPRIGVFLAHVPPSLTWDAVALWIEDLAARCGDRLLRVKGVVAATDVEGLVLVQAVGTMFSPPLRLPRGTGGTPGAVVLITRDLAAAAIREASQPHGIDVAEA